MQRAITPFQFVTASYLIRIRPERAHTLAELTAGLRACTAASIFHHTFQSLERHHYTFFTNDFAQWLRASCNEAGLAERLAAVDVRDAASLDMLRASLITPIDDHLRRLPESAHRPAFEPFYFCESADVAIPIDASATTLEELADGIRDMSLQTLHHHFINARVHLHLKTNDFSHWIDHQLHIPELAARLNQIDIYMNSLEDQRREILAELHAWRDR